MTTVPDAWEGGSPSAAVRASTARVMAACGERVWVGRPDALAAAAAAIAKRMDDTHFSLAAWGAHPLHPKGASDDDVEMVFLIDTLNFSFWADSPATLFTGAPGSNGGNNYSRYAFFHTRPPVEFEGQRYTGYWSLCAALMRAKAVRLHACLLYRRFLCSRR